MTPAATTPNSNMLCPKPRPAELETTLPRAATGDGTPDGAPVSPSRGDEPVARSSLALCPCTPGPARGAASAVVGVSALGPGGGDAPDSTLHPAPHPETAARRATATERPAPPPAPATTQKHRSPPAAKPAATRPSPTATPERARSSRSVPAAAPARPEDRSAEAVMQAAAWRDRSTPTAEQRSCHRSAQRQATRRPEATRQPPTHRKEESRRSPQLSW